MISFSLTNALSSVPRFAWVDGGIILVVLIVIILSATRRRFREHAEDLFFNLGWRFDVLLGLLMTGALYGILWSGEFVCVLVGFLKSDGTAVYGALLAAFAALLGFAVAVLAIVCTVIPTMRLERRLTGNQYDEFLSAFTFSIRMLGLCTLASLLAIFLNHSEHIREALFFVVVAIVAIAIPSVLRSAVSLEQVVKAVANRPVSGRRIHRPPNPKVEP